MKTVRAAVIEGIGIPWDVQELYLEEPRDNEVLIRVMASGLCHSDEHLFTGDLPQPLPLVGGHEGAGIVEAIGSKVSRVQPGDHIVTAFIPGCGVCDWCSIGKQYICDRGKDMFAGMLLDGTPRFFQKSGKGIGAMQRLGTFSNYLVAPEEQCIRMSDDIPFEDACLVACGVTTGWGSAVYAGGVHPGSIVLVIGVGGVGINAVQGSRMAGAEMIFAVDPIEFKRNKAIEFGAHKSFSSIDNARHAIDGATNGQGVDVAIITVGRVDGQIIGEAFKTVRKDGVCVVTSVGQSGGSIEVDPMMMTFYAKTLRGTIFGNANPTRDIPKLLSAYTHGQLELKNLITNTYALEQINTAYDDMREGRNIRGVIIHDH